ncbi:MAG TPA: FCD domain-containing protein, partial [Caulobacter sp.]|nr:FCD domain-containing protein [Caulobacter sp.]
RMKAAAEGEDDALSADIAFHVSILNATKNPFYRELHELVNTALRISIRFTNRIKGRTASIPSHEDVAEAIIARDADRAATAMRLIIVDVLELIRAASPSTESEAARREA